MCPPPLLFCGGSRSRGRLPATAPWTYLGPRPAHGSRLLPARARRRRLPRPPRGLFKSPSFRPRPPPCARPTFVVREAPPPFACARAHGRTGSFAGHAPGQPPHSLVLFRRLAAAAASQPDPLALRSPRGRRSPSPATHPQPTAAIVACPTPSPALLRKHGRGGKEGEETAAARMMAAASRGGRGKTMWIKKKK